MTTAADDDKTVHLGQAAEVGASGSAASNAMYLPLGMRLGEFEITGYVGEGGFSLVYLALDHSLERMVAIKEYMPVSLAARAGTTQVVIRTERHRDTFQAGLKSFINEGRLLAHFNHASLVKVYRFWEAHGTAYMVMPFYEGSTYKDTVRAFDKPPSEAWLRRVLDPLTQALSVIHAEHCYHRDIAPDNIMLLAGSGKPLLLDFGAARRVIGDRTQALTVILKPGYAPVEQYAEDPGMKQGPWTDVYALAAVVYWSITGRTPPTSVGRLLTDTYEPLTQCAVGRYSDAFCSAIDRALAVFAQQRTPSIDRLREELGLGATPTSAIAALTSQRIQGHLPATESTTVLRVEAPNPELDVASKTSTVAPSPEPRAVGRPHGAEALAAMGTVPQPVRRVRWARIGATAGLVLLVAAVAVAWWSTPSSSTPEAARSPAIGELREPATQMQTPPTVEPIPVASEQASSPQTVPTTSAAATTAARTPVNSLAAPVLTATTPVDRSGDDQAAYERALKARDKREAEARAQSKAQLGASLPAPQTTNAPAVRPPAGPAPAAPPAVTVSPEVKTVAQLCADRSNFISEQLCRSRACNKPEFASDPICIQFSNTEEIRRAGRQ